VLKKIENVKLFQKLDIIKNQNVHGKKEKIIVKKENVVLQLECVLIKNCKVTKRKCRWEGKSICKNWVNGCRWKVVGKTGRRKYCCKHLNVCRDGQCVKKK